MFFLLCCLFVVQHPCRGAGAIYFIPNYRVNYGGYLATSPSEGGLKGNYGLLDQARVLEWMRLYGGVRNKNIVICVQ